MASLMELLGKGAKPILFNPSNLGEIQVKDSPKLRQQDGGEAVDVNSEWIIVGYQFNAGLALPPLMPNPPGSFFFEDGVKGTPLSPTHYWRDIIVSPFVDCLIRCGLGKPIFVNLSQGSFSMVVYVWDPNYPNARRTNF